MRRRAACACCGKRRSPGFIRKARWSLENWCARAGWSAPTGPVRASAAGPSSIDTNWMHPSEKNLRFAFRRHYRDRALDRLHGTALGPSLPGLCHAGQPRRSLCGADLVQPEAAAAEDALGEFPELCARLENAEHASSERGAITVTRRLRRVYRGRTVLVGDASGGVDAITGEGLCLAFRQAALLGDCLASGDLARYQKASSRADPPSRPDGST